MAEAQTEVGCQYVVARYVHDPVRNEAVNLGVIVQAPEANYVKAKFVSAVRAKLPREASFADAEMVRAYLAEINRELERVADHERVPGQIHVPGTAPAALSKGYLTALQERVGAGRIQFSEPRGVLARDLDAELERVFSTFVSSTIAEVEAAPVRRSRLKTNLTRFFRKNGLISVGHPKEHVLKPDASVPGGHSGVKHTVDFACVNARLVVVETADLRTAPKERTRQAYEAALKLDDLRQGWKKKCDGFSVVMMDEKDAKELKPLTKILAAYSDLYVFSNNKHATKLRLDLEDALGRKRLLR